MSRSTTKSRFDIQLRELGFMQECELATPEQLIEVAQDVERETGKPTQLSRAQLRSLREKKIIPGFGYVDDITLAMDELGALWRAPGRIDLETVGFYRGLKNFEIYKVGHRHKPN